MSIYVYHTFMSNGEFWLAPLSVKSLRDVGTIVLDPDISQERFYSWDGKQWINNYTGGLPALIKAFLLIYSAPVDLKNRIRQDLDYEPIYLCNWK